MVLWNEGTCGLTAEVSTIAHSYNGCESERIPSSSTELTTLFCEFRESEIDGLQSNDYQSVNKAAKAALFTN